MRRFEGTHFRQTETLIVIWLDRKLEGAGKYTFIVTKPKPNIN